MTVRLLSLPDPTRTRCLGNRIPEPQHARQGRSCTTSSVWETFQRSLFSALLKGSLQAPSRKAGAKVLPLFHTAKHFYHFFSRNFSEKSEMADFHAYHFFAFSDEGRQKEPFSANQMPNKTKTVPTRAMGVRGS